MKRSKIIQEREIDLDDLSSLLKLIYFRSEINSLQILKLTLTIES